MRELLAYLNIYRVESTVGNDRHKLKRGSKSGKRPSSFEKANTKNRYQKIRSAGIQYEGLSYSERILVISGNQIELSILNSERERESLYR